MSRLLASSTFRLAALYLGLFGLSAALLFGFIYWSTAGFAERQTDEIIQTEINALAEQFNQQGMVGLVRALDRRSASARATRGLYLLTDASFKPLVGNLSRWPDAEPDAEGWVTFALQYADEAGGDFGRARIFRLRGPLYLLVGRDIRERSAFESLIRGSLIWGAAITFALALAGGTLMSRAMLRRVDAINDTSREIIAGDFSRRVPVSGSGDEFDRLAGNLNAMLDQIERLMAGMKQVTSNIAHDLRTPLNRLRGRLEQALIGNPDPDAYREALAGSIEEADNLLKTFAALLNIAQAEAGATRERFAAVDLAALIRDVADLYDPLAEERGLTLKVDAPAASPVQGDRHLLFQAVANLLDNAIKFTAAANVPDKSIAIRLDQASPGVDIVVQDHGPGIPPDQRTRVLDPFVRLEDSRSEPGNGLGLSLAAAVAQLHGGALSLEDNKPGLRATLSLPVGPAG